MMGGGDKARAFWSTENDPPLKETGSKNVYDFEKEIP